MAQKRKPKDAKEKQFDLDAYRWDDHLFSDLLSSRNLLNSDEALDFSRALREEIRRRELQVLTLPLLEKIIEDKLRDYGLPGKRPLKLESAPFLRREELPLTANARTVLERRYLRRDGRGKVRESAEGLFRRVAHHIALGEEKNGHPERVEEMEERFYQLMSGLLFLPNSPTLMNAGLRLGQLAACFVLPVEDSMEGIFDALKNAALIHKSGGGTGFSFSRLRPKDSKVGSTGGVASGPVSFMKIFNTATEQVKQGGTRRGANMAVLRVDHPDILAFITCKKDMKDLNNFNISVALTDGFMDALSKEETYALVDPRKGRKRGTLQASEVFDLLVQNAWESGDPGVIFIDRMNRDNPTPELGGIESTNPCGEQPLLPLEACNLGSINLSVFTVRREGRAVVDYDHLREVVHLAVRFLDNVVDMSLYPLPEIERMARGNRKIGLGVMGFADLLFQLGVPYDSEDGLAVAEEVMAFIQEESHRASMDLAESRGVFPNFEKSVFRGRKGARYRNATTTTIAPTGTLSIIAGASSGIEPLFALSFMRRVMDGDELPETNPYFERTARERGFYSPELMEEVARRGTIRAMEGIPEDVKAVFATAHDVDPEWHVRMQAAFQKYTDNAVSKTVNLPRDATPGDVRRIYELAYRLGCKGVTIYRDGSRDSQVLSVDRGKGKDGQTAIRVVKDRPETLQGFTTKITTGMGNLYVTITEFEGHPFEVFATIGKSGKSTTAKTEAIGRLVSLALRSGVSVEKIVDQLKGICGEYPVFQEGGMVLSIPDAISKVLERRYVKPSKSGKRPKRENSLLGLTCPDCGQTVSFEEGCMTCHFCGFSRCG